ncbi:MAG: lamin tail domain-containing protein [Rhodospirillales bacterium]|nr:lamin tail domain-containing protein [Rhodospirillales bacterium]
MKQVILAGIMLALASLACGGSGDLAATPTAPPSRAATAVPPTAAAAPSATPTSANTATPTITPGVTIEATIPPTATPGARSNAAANLRAGPGTEFEQIGAVAVGDDLQVTGRNAAGDWYRLASGAWIAAFLVDGAPAGLAVAEDIPTVAPPVAVEPTDPPSTPAPVAAIGGQVRITGILRDGLVSQTETDEYVEITNVGDGPADLTGWRLESERRGDDEQQIFHFPTGFTMNAGQVCRIYTNEDHPEWCGLSFNHGRSGVWANEDPDAAVLIDAAGTVVQRWE